MLDLTKEERDSGSLVSSDFEVRKQCTNGTNRFNLVLGFINWRMINKCRGHPQALFSINCSSGIFCRTVLEYILYHEH